jgi:hypothetical protein
MALGALLRDNQDALEADLQRYYQVDIADLWRSGLSVRRLSVFVAALPPDSMTVSELSKMPREWADVTPWLLDYVIQYLTGEPHPARPDLAQAADKKAERLTALLDHKRRMAEREALLAQEP